MQASYEQIEREIPMQVKQLDSYWRSLLEDIERWRDNESLEPAIQHHIGQFRGFCEQAYNCLIEAYPQGDCEPADDWPKFRVRTIGGLTSLWMLLREMASQRLPDSPYLDIAKALDDRAADRYRQLARAFPPEVGERLSKSLPLVYIGHIHPFNFFRQNGPALLSVPFSAPYDPEAQRLVSSAVSRAVLEQLPDLLPELGQRFYYLLQDSRASPEPDRQTEILYEVIAGWLHGIVMDSLAAALGGPAYAESTLWPAAFVDDVSSIGDSTQIPFYLRPYVHLAAFKHLSGNNPSYAKEYAEQIAAFEENVERTVGPRLECRVKFSAIVTVVTLGALKDRVVEATRDVFDTPLQALHGQSLGDVLVACTTGGQAARGQMGLPEWREISDWECGRLVLDDIRSTIQTIVCWIVPNISPCQ
jgi:hypothetical protein